MAYGIKIIITKHNEDNDNLFRFSISEINKDTLNFNETNKEHLMFYNTRLRYDEINLCAN